jgi:NAD(P)-dependent dehydrogenase (short-subunit alcohol dehydrogenase family)
VAVPTAGIYEATKFAIEGFAEALAAEVNAFGIRTTLIEPGAYATDFLSGASLKTAEPMAIYNKFAMILPKCWKPRCWAIWRRRLGRPLRSSWTPTTRLSD